MKKLFTLMLVPCLMLAVFPLQAADKKDTPTEKTTKKPVSGRKLPFHGKVSAVDLKTATIQVGKRTFHISKTTRLIKDDKPMELSEELVGQRIGGSYIAMSDGTLEAQLIRVAKPKGTGKKPDKS